MTYEGDPWLAAKALEKFGPEGVAAIEAEAHAIYHSLPAGGGTFGYRLYRMKRVRALRSRELRLHEKPVRSVPGQRRLRYRGVQSLRREASLGVQSASRHTRKEEQ